MSKRGFSLIELLTVVAIIGILAGMIGTASFAARRQAYSAQAQAEIRELSNACKAYYIAFGEWPGEGRDLEITQEGSIYKNLTGDNDAKISFFEFDVGRFEEGGPYLDPWGKPYLVSFDSETTIERSQTFNSSVTLPMSARYDFIKNSSSGTKK